MPRDVSVQVYVSADERSIIRIAAATNGMSMSDYLRTCSERIQASRRWMHAYQLVQNAPLSSPRAEELILSEVSAILCGTESELDFLDPIYRTVYEAFAQSVDSETIEPVVLLPV